MSGVKLLFHGGLNKAGSSYLQDCFQLNRRWLRRFGIHYPTAVNRRGGGNADVFVWLLKQGDWRRAGRLLDRWIAGANRRSCQTLLLSAESLFHRLADEHQFARIAGEFARRFSAVSVHLVFRDPVSHSISAFCHRAGTRPMSAFEDWVRDEYEGPGEVAQFLANLRMPSGVDWRLIEYDRTNLAEDSCRSLGLPIFPILPDDNVNVSVSCVEAEQGRRLFGQDPELAMLAREEFKRLCRTKKECDEALQALFATSAARYFLSHGRTYRRLDEILETDFLGQCEHAAARLIEGMRSCDIGLPLSRSQHSGILRARRALEQGRRPLPRALRFSRRIWEAAETKAKFVLLH